MSESIRPNKEAMLAGSQVDGTKSLLEAKIAEYVAHLRMSNDKIAQDLRPSLHDILDAHLDAQLRMYVEIRKQFQ